MAVPRARAMMRRLTAAVLLFTLMGILVGSAHAARPESVEIKDRAGNRGTLPITVTDDGAAYIAPDRLAAMLKGAWHVKGDRATLTIGKHTAEFVRGQSSARVAGQTIALDSAARVVGHSWLVSRDFLSKGLPRLSAGVSVVAVSESRKPQTRTVQGSVPLEEMRYRSYPSFTRIVIETGAKLAYAVVSTDEEVRVRLPGLSLSDSRVEEIGDGLVQEVRLEPAKGILARALQFRHRRPPLPRRGHILAFVEADRAGCGRRRRRRVLYPAGRADVGRADVRVHDAPRVAGSADRTRGYDTPRPRSTR